MLWEREPLVATHHFQDERNIPRARHTDIVVVILWSRLGVLLPESKYRGVISGRPVTGTEWEFEDALAGARDSGVPDLLLYRKLAPIVADLDDEAALEERRTQRAMVQDFIGRWFQSEDRRGYTAASHTFAAAAEFEEQLYAHLRELLQRRAGAQVEGIGIRWHGAPFRGLLSFEYQHAPVFFGRTRARNELRELLAREEARGCGFVLVLGASGSGKSSLVKAGLLPDVMLHGMIGRVALVRWAQLRPSDDPGDLVGSLASAVSSETALPELEHAHYSRPELTALLRDAPARAGPALRQALSAAGKKGDSPLAEHAEARLLLIIDQLEELFTLDGIDAAERDRFVAALDALARSGLVWVVATMRSDFYDRLETMPALSRLARTEACYRLLPPDDSELGQIIRLPAQEAGLRFGVDARAGVSLDEVIRQAASKDRNALPLLSFLLDQLWHRRSAQGELTFQSYQELGGLEGALGQRAEEVFSVLPDRVQATLPRVLRTLVTVGPGTQVATGRPAFIDVFAEGSPERELIAAFLAPEARLLVADEGIERRARVRAAHEALFTHWQRAKDQIAADRRDLELLGRLELGAERWRQTEKRNRDSLVLSRGLPLAEALNLARRWVGELPAEVSNFIDRSRAVAKRRRRRLVLTLFGAVAALPILLTVVWTVMVWRGVRAVDARMEFVPIPGRCFTMGTPVEEEGRFEHEVQHQVCLPAFELGKYAVTQEEWRLVMVENPDPARFKGGRNPVEMVSWDDVRAFAWRMRLFGSHNYRLPSEAEWEYAARAGTTTTWFWGDRIEDGCAYANLRDLTYESKHFNVGEAIIQCHDGFDETAPIGSFKPNPFGLYDMIGNVFQWTEDCYGDYANAPADGTAAEAENCPNRVVRGGSWTAKPRFTRSGSRDIYPPVNRNDVVGFRLAR